MSYAVRKISAAMISHQPLFGVLAGLLASAIWGAYLSLSRVGVTSGLDWFDVAFVRYVVAGPFVAFIWTTTYAGTRPIVTLGQASVVAALLGPPFIFVSVGGYAYAPLAHGAVILPTTLTLGGYALARLFLKQRLSLLQMGGVVTILTGLFVITGVGNLGGSRGVLRGDLMFALAGLLWSGFSVLQQRWKLNAVDVTLVVSLAGFLSIVPAYLSLRGVSVVSNLTAPMLATQIIVQGVLSGVVAMIAFSQAVKLLGATNAATFPALVPGFALLIGIPLTMEIPTPVQYIGIAILALGLCISLAEKN